MPTLNTHGTPAVKMSDDGQTSVEASSNAKANDDQTKEKEKPQVIHEDLLELYDFFYKARREERSVE